MALTDEKKVNDIIDINIDAIKKTRFRINGDSKAIIELNLSDMGIVERLEKGLEQLQNYMHDVASVDTEDADFTSKLKEINEKMCESVDYIFDYPVSAVCSKGGTMYDLYDGMFRYEHIIDGLSKLYTNNLNEEFKKLRKRVQKYTDKYTAPKSTPKRKKS